MDDQLTSEKALREYLSTIVGGLKDDRDTASYALEFLKTERANLLLAQARANLTLAVHQIDCQIDSMQGCFNWLHELMPRAAKLADEVKKLIALAEKK